MMVVVLVSVLIVCMGVSSSVKAVEILRIIMVAHEQFFFSALCIILTLSVYIIKFGYT